METPLIDHLTAKDYEEIYEPAEDSFLLLDALEADLPYLKELQPRVCLEIGPGSGVIVTAIAQQLRHSLCLAADINGRACAATKRTAHRNGATVECINCNLVDALRMNVVDLLVFNPPYVVTTDEELQTRAFDCAEVEGRNAASGRDLAYAWAGGKHGRRVIDELVMKLDAILAPRGVFYLLLLRENKPDELMEKLEEMGFRALKHMERRIPGEYLYIIKVIRK